MSGPLQNGRPITAFCAVIAFALGAVLAGCSLNPQPLPPWTGEPSSTGGGYDNYADDAGSVPSEADAGERGGSGNAEAGLAADATDGATDGGTSDGSLGDGSPDARLDAGASDCGAEGG